MKRFFALFFSLIIVISTSTIAPVSVHALNNKGSCGGNISYKFDSSTGTLTLTGSGAMDNYNSYTNPSPFFNHSEIKKLVINNGIRSLGNYAFNNCKGLTSIEFSDSVVSIGYETFSDCTALTALKLGIGVKSMDHFAFKGCSLLETVTIPNGFKDFGCNSFEDCTRLKEITIPNSVDYLSSWLFANCTSLKKAIIPKSVDYIDNYVFKDCYGLTDIYYGGSKEDWGDITIGFLGNEPLKYATIHYGKVSLAKAAVSNIVNKTYTGKTVKQSIKVKYGKKTLKAGTDYNVSYKNNKNIGTAIIIITGKGKYSGKVKKTFKIVPKGTKISKVTAVKKGFTAKWKKQSSKTSGYQIQYSTNSKFKKDKKSVSIKGNKNTSKTIRGLKSRQTYYVRVRTYKEVNGKKYYSKWSEKESIRTK